MKLANAARGSLLTAAIVVLASQGQAQDAVQEYGDSGEATVDSGSKLRIYGGARLGFGGEVETDPKGGVSSDDDLLTTFGAQFGLDYGLHTYFAAGLELRLAGVNSDGRDDADIGRDIYIDVDLKPRGRYTLSGIPLELYGTLPFGVTFISTNGDLEDNLGAGFGNVEVSQGPGFNLGIGAGLVYFFTDKLGINAEAAYLMYWWSSEAKAGAAKSEADLSAGQFTLFANLVYAL